MPPAKEFNWDSDSEDGERDEVKTELGDDAYDGAVGRISDIRRFRDVIYDYSKSQIVPPDPCLCKVAKKSSSLSRIY